MIWKASLAWLRPGDVLGQLGDHSIAPLSGFDLAADVLAYLPVEIDQGSIDGLKCPPKITCKPHKTKARERKSGVGGSEKWGHLAGLWRCFRWQQPLPAFHRAAGRTIRFWTFPCSGSSPKVKSPARQPASLGMFSLPSTSGRVVLVVRHFGPFAHCHQHKSCRENALYESDFGCFRCPQNCPTKT